MQSSSNTEGSGSRLRTVILILPVAVLLGGLGFAIRTGLAGGHSAVIEQDLILGGLFAVIVVLCLGGVYLFTDREKRWNIKWRTVLFSIYMTAAISAILYAIIEPTVFLWLVPMSADDIMTSMARRALLGAIDGSGYGLVVGFFISSFDQRATRFTRAGILRYCVVYALLFAGLIIIMLLNFSSELGDRFSSLLTILFMFVLKYAIHWWDKAHPEAE